MAEEKYLETEIGKIAYQKSGNGENVIICFHGFAQDKSVFKSLEKATANSHTIYSIDLFFHGSSDLSLKKPVSSKAWKDVFIRFCETEAIGTYSLFGFSLGGRFAINSFMAQPQRCTALHLIASDGIARSPWYEVATFPMVGVGLFSFLSQSDRLIPTLIGLIGKTGMVDKKVLKFGQVMTETLEQRMQLFHAWVYFKPLWISNKKLVKALNSSSTLLCCYTGKYDTIMPPNQYHSFLNKISNKKDTVLETGHNQLIDKTVEYITTSGSTI
jgi:pimeloyl-ACP methyl ester carboxylesterase